MKDKRAIRRLLILPVLAILTLIFALSAAAASDERTPETLRVGVPSDRCPIFYIDSGTGEITGIGADLMRTAAENAGFTVTFLSIREATLKDALDSDAYDIVMPFGSAIDSTAGHPTVVSENLMQTPFTLVTAGKKELHSISSLRIGMLRSQGGVAETVSTRFPGIEITLYETMQECVNALRIDMVDALLHTSYVWSYVLEKPSYSDLIMHPLTVFSMDFRAGTTDTPEGRERIERLNDGIRQLTDTTRQAIALDYTSRQLYQYDFSDYVYANRWFIFAGTILAAMLALIAVQRKKAIQRKHTEEIHQLEDRDSLTGLLSANGFKKRVEELLRTHPETKYFLVYNNIRDFKYINESLGRKAGNELLKFWAAKYKENLSEDETAGRIRADRYAVLRRLTDEDKMNAKTEKIFTPVQNFFKDRGRDIKVQMSTGIYMLTPQDYHHIDAEHMLDLAHIAEKKARESHETVLVFYDHEQWERGKRISDIINYLPAAIRNGDIHVWYQPQIRYGTGEITGAEALCRWEHSKLGWLFPDDFITTLEEAGLIFALDCFVWDTVCRDLQRWNEAGKHRSVSVNVSRDDIREDRDIAGHFRKLIQTYHLTPDQLRIEITETAYTEKPAFLISTTEKLRSLGFQVEMDDFGSGYSSLHMLKEVPLDRIKLDLHFLTATGDMDKCRTIISCMIQMVHLLGMELIAEGVETKEQADFLMSKGCDEMQGYYFHKPMAVADYERIMEENEGKSHIRGE